MIRGSGCERDGIYMRQCFERDREPCDGWFINRRDAGQVLHCFLVGGHEGYLAAGEDCRTEHDTADDYGVEDKTTSRGRIIPE